MGPTIDRDVIVTKLTHFNRNTSNKNFPKLFGPIFFFWTEWESFRWRPPFHLWVSTLFQCFPTEPISLRDNTNSENGVVSQPVWLLCQLFNFNATVAFFEFTSIVRIRFLRLGLTRSFTFEGAQLSASYLTTSKLRELKIGLILLPFEFYRLQLEFPYEFTVELAQAIWCVSRQQEFKTCKTTNKTRINRIKRRLG